MTLDRRRVMVIKMLVVFVLLSLAHASVVFGKGPSEPKAKNRYSNPEGLVTLSGFLKVWHGDKIVTDKLGHEQLVPVYFYSLTTKEGQAFDLKFVDDSAQNLNGTEVEISGKKVGKTITVHSLKKIQKEPKSSAKTSNIETSIRGLSEDEKPWEPVIGRKKLAVILINFANDPSEPFTAAHVKAKTFVDPDSISAY